MNRIHLFILLALAITVSAQAQNNSPDDDNVYKAYNPTEIGSAFQVSYFWKKQHFITANFDQRYTTERGLDGFMEKTFLDRLYRMQYSLYGNYCLDGKHWNIGFSEMLSQKTQGVNAFSSRLLLTHIGSFHNIDFIKQISGAYISNPDATGPYYSYEANYPVYDFTLFLSLAKRFKIKDKDKLRVSFAYGLSCRGPWKTEDFDYYNARFIDLTKMRVDISWMFTDLINLNLFAIRESRFTESANANTNGKYNVVTPVYGAELRFFIRQEKMQLLNYIF